MGFFKSMRVGDGNLWGETTLVGEEAVQRCGETSLVRGGVEECVNQKSKSERNFAKSLLSGKLCSFRT